MPNPDDAPSHEGHADDIGQAPAWAGEPLPKATAYVLDRPARPIGVRTRTRTVMRTAFMSEDRAAYFRSDTEDLCPIALSWARWVEMGRPDRITVTIEPGDRLT